MTVLSPAELAAIKAQIETAHEEVCALAEGKRRWTMRIPADEGRDSDLVISAALAGAEKLLAHADALEEQGSKLTAENELKRRRIEELEAELAKARAEAIELAAANAHDRAANKRLENRLATLEATPTSGTPHYIPPRGGLPATAVHGWSQVAEPTPEQIQRQAAYADAIGIAVRDEQLEAGEVG